MKLSKNQSGVSLLEVLSSMTIFAAVSAGLASTSVSTTRLNSNSRQTTVASFLIHDKVEELRSLDPATNPADFVTGSHSDANNPLSPIGEPGGVYTRSWQVIPNSPRVGLAEVLVAVSWNTPNGPRELRASTLICRTARCT